MTPGSQAARREFLQQILKYVLFYRLGVARKQNIRPEGDLVRGKSYYLTTLGEWRRKAHRFHSSHFVQARFSSAAGHSLEGADAAAATSSVLVLVEGDEGMHNELQGDPGWESLPHPLGNRAVSERVVAALVGHGVREGATTYEVAEAMARAHPVMRYQVF